MVFKKIEDSVAFRLTQEFKLATYRLVRGSPDAYNDIRFRSQLYDAVRSAESNIDEGFHRDSTGEIINFLGIARGSIAEAKRRIRDGVDCGYYSEDSIASVIILGSRAGGALAAWQRSLEPFLPLNIRRKKEERRAARRARSSSARKPLEP